MEAAKPLPLEYEVNIALGLVLSIITCGFYNVYWNYIQFKAMNTLLGREEYRFLHWLILTIVTCGLFHIYYEYKMGSELQVYMKARNYEVTPNLSVIGLVLSCLGLTILADAIYQYELNRLVRREGF